MEKTIACPDCPQHVSSIGRLRFHGLQKHKWADPDAKIASLPLPLEGNSQQNLPKSQDNSQQSQEVPSMPDQCPTCQLNAYKAEQSEERLKDFQAVAQKREADLTAALETARTEAAKLTTAQPKGDGMPTVADFVAHCQNCGEHGKDLTDWFSGMLERVPTADVQKLARTQGWWPPKPVRLDVPSGFAPASPRR